MSNSLNHPPECKCWDCDPRLDGRPIAWGLGLLVLAALVVWAVLVRAAS